ncbi:hypothetical protein B0H11DRAFT_436109 [Mycena galericulata]|nr:hypothetical protein B0H11DRAFT_436109 [Mycena galericulata]
MCDYSPNEARIFSTPGVAGVAVRAWTALLDDTDDIIGQENNLCVVRHFLERGTRFMDDMVEGAGGTMDDFAELIIRQFDLILANGEAALSGPKLNLLSSTLVLVAMICGMYLPERPQTEFSRALRPALLSRGLVKHLALAACALGQTMTPNASGVIDMCLALVGGIFLNPSGYQLLRVAVQNGLLRAILALGKRDLSADTHRSLGSLLTGTLAPATVDYHLLVDLKEAYFSVADEVTSDTFRRPELGDAWTDFLKALLPRLEVLNVFGSKDYIPRSACDNVECGTIREKAVFKRCSGCRLFVYCSRECQSVDWRRGHRGTCNADRARFAMIKTVSTSREREFMCALLDHDYQAAHARLCLDLASLRADDPDAVCFTVFDYFDAGPSISVQKMSAIEGSHFWDDIVDRASRSAGRLALHKVLMCDGNRRRVWITPFRTANPEMHDTMPRIALEHRDDQEFEAVGDFRNLSDSGFQIHQLLDVSALV